MDDNCELVYCAITSFYISFISHDAENKISLAADSAEHLWHPGILYGQLRFLRFVHLLSQSSIFFTTVGNLENMIPKEIPKLICLFSNKV